MVHEHVRPQVETVALDRLRLVWLALPFLPWLMAWIPWIAPFPSLGWFFLAFYFWPAEWAFDLVGMAPTGTFHAARLLPYCAVLALGLDFAMRVCGRRSGAWRMVRRRTVAAISIVALLAVIGTVGRRYLRWIDWPAATATPAQTLTAFEAHADRIDALNVYEMPLFLDQLVVARVRGRPDLLPRLTDTLDLEPVPDDLLFDEFWTAPGAYWWHPPRAGEFYGTRYFAMNDLALGGEHYLILHVPETDELWVWFRSTF